MTQSIATMNPTKMTGQPVKEPLDDDARWRLVTERDRSSDGAFVYAVDSTGIYCRPSCASRKPQRERVTLFSGPEAAETQGYRPCKRCRPQEQVGDDPDTKLVRLVCQKLAAEQTDSTELADVVASVGTSPVRLRRAFKKVTGLTFRQYSDARRLDQLKDRLRNGQDVIAALYDVGYGSTSRLYEKAPSQLGMTPATYRGGADGVRVAFTTVDCSLGVLLVAATERGVCAVHLGDDAAGLESELFKEYPAAQVRRSDGQLQRWVEAVLERLDGRPPIQQLPLDIRATAFQRLVWQYLTNIPSGETRTYGQIAKDLGRPHAARAVAQTCAANPVAVVVPCHRVVRQDGGMGGYRWGLDRKAALLERESTGRQANCAMRQPVPLLLRVDPNPKHRIGHPSIQR